MQVLVKPINQLDASVLSAWSELHAEVPQASPFLHPEFALAADHAQGDVEVALFEAEQRPLGFLPFRRRSRRSAEPLAGRLADVQGALLAEGADIDPRQFLSASGIAVWRFDRVPATQAPFAPYFSTARDCAIMDFPEGFDAYCRARKRAGSRSVEQALRKERKLARELGPLRLEFASDSSQVFDQLCAWKSAQRVRTRSPDVLQHDWARRLLDRLWRSEQTSCKAVLSALYAGDQLLAAHLGLVDQRTLHWWIPAYTGEFGQYSPGLVMLLGLARSAAERGYTRIDLGPGSERYKLSVKTGSYALHRGAVDANPLRRALWRSMDQGRGALRQSAVGERLSQLRRRIQT
ncbi:MAG: GNAT family N-acetyltransferase [Pseudomonadota bacterium]